MVVGSHLVKPSDACIKLEPMTSNTMAKAKNRCLMVCNLVCFVLSRAKMKFLKRLAVDFYSKSKMPNHRYPVPC